MKYFIKLINDEKLEITAEEFNHGRHGKAGDIVVINSVNDNKLYIPRRNIMFGFTLGGE